MNIHGFEIDLQLDPRVPVSIQDRNKWIKSAIETLLQHDYSDGNREFFRITSGDSLVLVEMFADEDGKLAVQVFDCMVKRCDLFGKSNISLKQQGPIVCNEDARNIDLG